MWLDLIGLYRYDNTIFDSFHLPEALEDSKDVIINNILMETAERELIYPDAGFMKSAIDAWSAKQCPIWKELYDTTQYEYTPIWNVDAKVKEEHNLTGTDYLTDDHTTERTHTDTITRTHGDTLTTTHGDTLTTTHGDTMTTDDSVYGYNESTAAPSDKSVSTHTGTTSDAHTGTTADAHTGAITDKDTGTRKHDTSDKGDITTTRTGNIGVTSTQSLIQEQREVVKFNIIDVIIQDFSNRFCLKVY